MLKHSSSTKVPNRSTHQTGDLMSLSTLAPSDLPPKPKLFNKPADRSLQTHDIQGARPQLPGYCYVNKPEYTFSTYDIAKSYPSPIPNARQTPYYSLKTDDIDRAWPCKDTFKSIRQYNNPLNPIYKLASYEIKPVTPPKFIRDSIQVQDIPGTKSDPNFKWQIRDTINVNDISGARPKPEKKVVKPDLMDPRDINREVVKIYNKECNPLMPTYLVRNQQNQVQKIGEILGNKPKVHVSSIQAHNRHLNTKDIEGASPSTKGLGPLKTKQRNYQKPLANSSDIEGAQAGSKKWGITTLRSTNPLTPEYTWVKQEQKQIVKKPEEKVSTDLAFQNSTNQFWGTASSPPVKVFPKVQEKTEFVRNSYKFHQGSGGLSPNQAFNLSAQKFYSNPRLRNVESFQQISNPHTIHKPKPKFAVFDPYQANFSKNRAKFFSEFPSRSPSVFGEPQSKPVQVGNLVGEASSRLSSSYKFNLNRNEIGTPNPSVSQKSRGGESNQGSKRSSELIRSAKSLF